MKKGIIISHRIFATVLSIGMLTGVSQGAVLVWNFTDLNGQVDSIDGVAIGAAGVGDFSIGNSNAAVSGPINGSSVSSGYTGASGGGNIGNAAKAGILDPTTSSYFTVTLTPSTGSAISLTDFDFGTRSTATGSQAFSLRSSIDGFASDAFTGTIANNSAWSLKDNTFTTVTGAVNSPVEFRLYTYSGTAAGGSSTIVTRADDFKITATGFDSTPVALVPEPSSAIALVGGLGMLASLRRRGSVTL